LIYQYIGVINRTYADQNGDHQDNPFKGRIIAIKIRGWNRNFAHGFERYLKTK
jgi:hypothetical protein